MAHPNAAAHPEGPANFNYELITFCHCTALQDSHLLPERNSGVDEEVARVVPVAAFLRLTGGLNKTEIGTMLGERDTFCLQASHAASTDSKAVILLTRSKD